MEAILQGTVTRKNNHRHSALSASPSLKVSPGFTDLGTPDLRTLKPTAIVDLLEEQISRRNSLIEQRIKKQGLERQ